MLCVLSATVDKERNIKVTYQIHGVCVASVDLHLSKQLVSISSMADDLIVVTDDVYAILLFIVVCLWLGGGW
jgi:hypothetical protein